MINNAQIKLHSWAKQSKAQLYFAVIRKENWEIGAVHKVRHALRGEGGGVKNPKKVRDVHGERPLV